MGPSVKSVQLQKKKFKFSAHLLFLLPGKKFLCNNPTSSKHKYVIELVAELAHIGSTMLKNRLFSWKEVLIAVVKDFACMTDLDIDDLACRTVSKIYLEIRRYILEILDIGKYILEILDIGNYWWSCLQNVE